MAMDMAKLKLVSLTPSLQVHVTVQLMKGPHHQKEYIERKDLSSALSDGRSSLLNRLAHHHSHPHL